MEAYMYPTNTNSALESLAAFAIVAAASVLTTISFSLYVDWVRKNASKNNAWSN